MAARPGIAQLLLAVVAGCAVKPSPAPEGQAGRMQPAAPPVITCLLQAPPHVSLTEPVVPVTFMLHNAGIAEIRVLARHTPLEGILGDLFEVTLANQRLAYRGPMVKRGAPDASEFVTLAPGDHVRATVDLLEGYDLSSAGQYTVRFSGTGGYACNELRLTRD
jgi:hypothetical protein